MKANVHVKNLQKLIDRVDELEKEKVAFINTNHNLADRIEGLKEDNKKLSKDVSWWQDNFHDVKQDRDVWKKNCQRLQADKVEADRIIAGLEIRNLRLTKENESLEEKVNSLEADMSSWRHKALHVRAVLNYGDSWGTKSECDDLKDEVDRLKNANRVMEEERDSWRERAISLTESFKKEENPILKGDYAIECYRGEEVLGNCSEIIEYLTDKVKTLGDKADDTIYGLHTKDPKTYRRDCVDKKRKIPEWAKKNIHGDWANSEASSDKQNGVKQAEEGVGETKYTFGVENLVKKYSNAHLDKKRRPLDT